MPQGSLDDQIKERIDAFAEELAYLVRQSAVESVHAALGSPSIPRRRGPAGRSARGVTRKKGRRGRRSTLQVDDLADQILSSLRAQSGRGVGELADEIGVTAKDLRSPILKLLEEKKVRRTGQKRGTKYHVGGRGAGAKKGSRRKKARRKTKSSA